MIHVPFDHVRRHAQALANRQQKPFVILNLNRAGRALYVIRDVGHAWPEGYEAIVFPTCWWQL